MNKLNILILLVVLLILQGCNNERIEIDNKRISLYDNLIPKNHFNNRYVDSLRLVYKRNGYLVGIKLYSYGRVNINMALEFYSDSISEIFKRKSLYINTFLKLSEFEEYKIIWDNDLDYIVEDYYKDTSKTNIWIRYLLFKIHKEKNLNKNKYENYNKYYNLKLAYRYINEALEIEPENQFLKSELISFKIDQGNTFDIQTDIDKLNKSFRNKKIDSVRKEIEHN